MWIEKVRLEGFKSFRELTEVDFHPGHNLVIGHNGAGKSNLLHAVSAIIDVPAVSREDRQHLISLNSTYARVEVVFNNESRRLPFQVDKVVVMRQFSSKSDEIRVNGSPRSRQDLITMFESAGISKDNRYNVVKTADVYTLCAASDADRLGLIQELAGLSVYYDVKEKTDASVKGTKDDLDEVTETLSVMDQTLETLSIESRQAKKYKKAEQMSTLLETTLTKRQVDELKEKMGKAKEKLKEVSDDMSKRNKAFEVSEKVLGQCNDNMEKDNSKRVQLEDNKSRVEDGISVLESRYAEGKEEIKDLDRRLRELSQAGSDLEAELEALEVKRNKTKAGLDLITAQLSEEAPTLEALTIEVGSHQKRLDAGADVATLVSSLDRNRDDLKRQIEAAQAEVNQVEESLKARKSELAETQSTLAEIHDQREGYAGELETLRAQRQLMRNERINSTEELAHCQSRQKAANDACHEMHQRLLAQGGESKNLVLGLEIVKRILIDDPEVNQGYFGTLADCFALAEDWLSAAVSSVAGKRLFYHVVSTKVLATRILQRQKDYNMKGEIYCLPLDTVHNFTLRQDVWDRLTKSKIGQPLTALLAPKDPAYQRALNFIFGRFVLVKDTSAFVKVRDLVQDLGQGVDCVTVDGDQASGKGVLTGGYYGRTDKLKLYRNRENARLEMEEAENELRAVETSVMHKEAEEQRVESQCQKLEAQINRLATVYDERSAQVNCGGREVRSLEERLDMAKKALSAKTVALAQDDKTRQDLLQAEEEGQEAGGGEAVKQRPEDVVKRLKELQIQLRKKSADVRDLEKKKAVLANRLGSVVEPKVDDVRKAIRDNQKDVLSAEAKGENLKEMLTEMKKMRVEKAASINEIDSELDKVVESILSWQTKKEKLQKKRDDAREAMEKVRNDHEDAVERYNHCQKVLEEEIKLLGNFKAVQPSASMAARLESMTATEIKKELDKIKTDLLKGAEDINFSAVADHETVLATRDMYRREATRLTSDMDSFQDVMENLVDCSQQKVEFTLKQVAKYFKENFSLMAPAEGGQAELRLQMAPKKGGRAGAEVESGGDSSSQAAATQDSNASSQMSWTSSVLEDDRRDGEKIIGVVVNVKFKKEEPFQDMRLLSGGQKTLVALALIFAFQKCNQSQVCVLDEVDAALDSAKRKKLADYIRSRAGTQFISTTFRKELLDSGDQFVGVEFVNDVSKVQPVDINQARHFVTTSKE